MLKTNQKIEAFEKLLQIAEEGSFDLYASTWGIYGERHAWPVDCLKPLRELRVSKSMVRQQALDETLKNLTLSDFPNNLSQLAKEREMIRLTLMAGANPNSTNLDGRSIFESFWIDNKVYGMLEIAKDERFVLSYYPDDIFKSLGKGVSCYLPFGKSYPFAQEEIPELNRQGTEDQKELLYTLFQKNMYPTNPKVFEKLAPIVLKKDPQFFDKKKEQVQKSLTRAKTPIQIYSALIGKGKEKN